LLKTTFRQKCFLVCGDFKFYNLPMTSLSLRQRSQLSLPLSTVLLLSSVSNEPEGHFELHSVYTGKSWGQVHTPGTRLFTALYFLVFLFRSLNAQIGSRENASAKGRLDWVGDGDRETNKPHPACFALASLAFSFACAEWRGWEQSSLRHS